MSPSYTHIWMVKIFTIGLKCQNTVKLFQIQEGRKLPLNINVEYKSYKVF